MGGAAFQLMKFITPPAQAGTSPTKPGVTYSEVTTGVNPTYATLGLLGTGALGSVLYSYVATDSDLASSATALALGAVDAIKRNDIVDAATNAIAAITGNVKKEEDLGNQDYTNYGDYPGYSDYQNDYSHPVDTKDYKDSFDYSYQDPTSYADYSDPDPYQGKADPYQEQQNTYQGNPTSYKDQANLYHAQQPQSKADPYQEQQNAYQAKPTPQHPSKSIAGNIEFYDPGIKVPDLPLQSYSGESNSWGTLHSRDSTEHLYRAFHT
jgi:hypothetical protein